MLRVWGRLTSVNVQKVVWTAGELGLAFERREAGGAHGVVDTPEYRRMNPNGLVPVIEDDGFVLWESNAIVRYLAATHGAGTLWPDDARRRADVDRWMEWQSTTFTPAMRDAFLQTVRTPAEKRDPAVIEASRAASEKAAAILDAHLAGRAFVAGDAFSMEAGEIAGRALLDRADRPTAIFAVNDNTAIGVLAAAHALGLRIPEDLSLVGYNDIPVVSRLPVSLTTVRVPFGAIAVNALDLLQEALTGAAPRTIVAAPTLIPRRSTARPA